MSVLHLNIASFPIQVEILGNRALAGRPAAVALADTRRAPLICVSPEAFGAGIRKGMSVAEARTRERKLLVLPPNPRLYQGVQKKLLALAESFTPVYEPARLGSLFLDMAGTERLFGKTVDVASRLRARLIREWGWKPTLGVAENKLVSRIAAKLVRPQGLCDVFPGNEAGFLKPLEIELLPGIGEVAPFRVLRELAIRRIGDLAQVPEEVLTRLFGKKGVELHRASQGIDLSPVRLPERAPTVAAQEIFPAPTNETPRLLASLRALIETVGSELRRNRRVAGGLRLAATYADGARAAREVRLDPPSQNDFALFRAAEAQWGRFLSRRTAVKSLAVAASAIQTAFAQLDWTADRREESLLAALDFVREKHGKNALTWGRK